MCIATYWPDFSFAKIVLVQLTKNTFAFLTGRDIKTAIVAFGGDLTGELVAGNQTFQKLIEKGKGGPEAIHFIPLLARSR